MTTQHAQAGDILLYRRVMTLTEALIDVGEVLEDGPQNKIYYHCAVALDEYHEISALASGVRVYSITYNDEFDIYRLPIPPDKLKESLDRLKTLEGQPYDWVCIVDDSLRYLTRGLVHLPEWWVRSTERHCKICITFIRKDLKWANFNPPIPLTLHSSPEDLALALRKWRVT